MLESVRIVIDDPSKTGEARRRARHMTADLGLDETTSEQVSIVVTEACTNVLKHARQGELILQSIVDGPASQPVFEVMALDRGPGMADLPHCLVDGYSTAGTPGTGLGAVLRLTQHADFYSHPGLGTGILARWWNGKSAQPSSKSFRISAVNVAKPGQDVCGDTWASVQFRHHLSVLVADGLGHGFEASLAASQAARVLHENPDLRAGDILELCHRALRGTRGAAVAVARIDGEQQAVTFSGIGNIAARIHSGSRSQHLVSVNGTAGHQAQRLREFRYPWPPDGMLQLNSDGLASGAGVDDYPGLALHDPALIAGILYRDFTRGRDDATVVVAKAA